MPVILSPAVRDEESLFGLTESLHRSNHQSLITNHCSGPPLNLKFSLFLCVSVAEVRVTNHQSLITFKQHHSRRTPADAQTLLRLSTASITTLGVSTEG